MLEKYFLSFDTLLQLKGFEFIKAIHLDPVPFDMDRDLLTPTFKKKRPQLLKYYKVPCLFINPTCILLYFVQGLARIVSHENCVLMKG